MPLNKILGTQVQLYAKTRIKYFSFTMHILSAIDFYIYKAACLLHSEEYGNHLNHIGFQQISVVSSNEDACLLINRIQCIDHPEVTNSL